MNMAELCHERRECESADRSSRYTDAPTMSVGPARVVRVFESGCLRLWMPDNDNSVRGEPLFCARQRRSKSGPLFVLTIFERSPSLEGLGFY